FHTKADLTQAKVISFMKQLKKRDYRHSLILLDERWHHESSSHLSFNSAKIPDPKTLVSTLHQAGYKLGLVVSPYVAKSSKNFANKAKFLVKNLKTVKELLLTNNTKALIDVSIPK